MSEAIGILEPSEESRSVAMFLAMVVRNAMEDFHCEHLDDGQMRELNPIIRDAICTGLHAMMHCESSKGAQAFVEFQARLIPDYWEPPELLDDFVRTIEMMDCGSGSDRPASSSE